MSSRNKTIFVYDDFKFGKPILLGTLFAEVIRGNEKYSFEFNTVYFLRRLHI